MSFADNIIMDEIGSHHVVREWGTSRYREDKKWVKGTLKLGTNFLCFKEAESDKGFMVSLDCITGNYKQSHSYKPDKSLCQCNFDILRYSNNLKKVMW